MRQAQELHKRQSKQDINRRLLSGGLFGLVGAVLLANSLVVLLLLSVLVAFGRAQQQQMHEISPPPANFVVAISRHQQSPDQHPAKHQLAAAVRSLLARQLASNPDAPKLIPLSALDRYQEGTDLRLFCSASAPSTGGRLQFEWRKNQNELLTGTARQQQQQRAQISMVDDDASVLRIGPLEASDSGNYTCLARNQFGQDASTVRVDVNVRLKWIVEPPSEVQVRAGKFLQIECNANGQPAPLISWTSLKDRHTINTKVLRFDRATVNDSGLYECRATSPLALQHSNNNNHHYQHLNNQLSPSSSQGDDTYGLGGQVGGIGSKMCE